VFLYLACVCDRSVSVLCASDILFQNVSLIAIVWILATYASCSLERVLHSIPYFSPSCNFPHRRGQRRPGFLPSVIPPAQRPSPVLHLRSGNGSSHRPADVGGRKDDRVGGFGWTRQSRHSGEPSRRLHCGLSTRRTERLRAVEGGARGGASDMGKCDYSEL
jgi:hypothetical protein